MANQVKDGWKELKQKYFQKEIAINNFLSCNLYEEPSARYSRFPEIMRAHMFLTKRMEVIIPIMLILSNIMFWEWML
jgi:hypothetical protein